MATKFILFASPDYVKQATVLDRTVDDDLLSPCIHNAQERHILPTLGENLYDTLASKVSGGTVSGSYKTLMDGYVTPCLAHYAMAEVIPHLRVRLALNSATTASSEQAAAVPEAELRAIVSRAEQLGNFHKERLIDWLMQNGSLVPEYLTNTSPQLEPTRRNYTQGLNVDPTYSDQSYKIIKQLLGLKT